MHCLANSVMPFTFDRFFRCTKVELLLLSLCGHRVDSLLQRRNELLELVTRHVLLGDRDWEFDRDTVTKLVPRVVFVQHLQSPH